VKFEVLKEIVSLTSMTEQNLLSHVGLTRAIIFSCQFISLEERVFL
jgi:hypothetical protein